MNLREIRIGVADLWANAWVTLGNARRRLRPAEVDYVILDLSGPLPEYIPPPPRWQRWLPFDLPLSPGGLSLSGLRHILEQIAGDPRPLGVLLNLDGMEVGWAKAQSVRDALARFRAKGKKVVAYANDFNVGNYFVASAADTIIAAPPARWSVMGLRSELTFLKDTLGAYGIQAEVINVSPYKTAADPFARSDISPQQREMLSWLMDGEYEALVSAIAAGRKLDPEAVRALIDRAPMPAEAARENKLLDAVLYEDAVAEYLAPPGRKGARRRQRRFPWRPRPSDAPRPAPAQLRRRGEARPALQRPVRWRSGSFIGIISLEGAIMPGRSQRLPVPIPLPFVGNALAGAETVAQQLRQAEKDDEIAAIVLYVNSRGGAAGASQLIWREVDRVRRAKPVVVCMGDYAASGGYFVSAAAQWIVAQPLTITGSIGVIFMKPVTAGLYGRFNANRVSLQRGANAGLYGDDATFTPEGRAAVQGDVDALYADFKRVVTSGRKLEDEALEPVAGGRVWLGQQALAHKLVDELGDLHTAIEKARQLAKLPADRWTPMAWFGGTGGNQWPPPFPASPASQTSDFLAILPVLLRERFWAMDPFEIRSR